MHFYWVILCNTSKKWFLQMCHSKKLVIILPTEGNVGLLWELRWKGKFYTWQWPHMKNFREVRVCNVAEELQNCKNFRMIFSTFDVLCNIIRPLVAPAASCPREPVPTDKCAVWPVNALKKCFHCSFAKYALHELAEIPPDASIKTILQSHFESHNFRANGNAPKDALNRDVYVVFHLFALYIKEILNIWYQCHY